MKFKAFKHKQHDELLAILAETDRHGKHMIGSVIPGIHGNYYDHIIFLHESNETEEYKQTARERLEFLFEVYSVSEHFPVSKDDLEIVTYEII